MDISIGKVLESRIQTNNDTEKYLRNYWKLRTDVWFDIFKSHPENCSCSDCYRRQCDFFDWSGPGPHPEFCDCDYCIPANSSFCTCEECIPDIIEFDMNGKVPLVQPSHSERCKCDWCEGKCETYYNSS